MKTYYVILGVLSQDLNYPARAGVKRIQLNEFNIHSG